jgi:hypothetical protein
MFFSTSISIFHPGAARFPAAWSSFDDLFASKYLLPFLIRASVNTTCNGIFVFVIVV